MIRGIGGAVLGFVAYNVAAFVCFTILWFVLGADGSFEPGIWEVSSRWILSGLVAYLLSGAAGGWVAAKIGRGSAGPLILFAVVLVLLMYEAIYGTGGTDPRPDDVAILDAMNGARYPPWAELFNVIAAGLGVVFGSVKVGHPDEVDQGDAEA